MFLSRGCSVVSLLLLASPLGGAARPQDVQHTPRPAVATHVVLESGGPFGEIVARLQRESPTFRGQMRRLTGGRVRVRVWRVDVPLRSAVRARTVMARHGSDLATADIHVPVSPYTVELLAHEVEHLIEQLDRVDFEAHRDSGDVWRASDGSFETRRAIEVGRRVADEAGAPTAPRAAR